MEEGTKGPLLRANISPIRPEALPRGRMCTKFGTGHGAHDLKFYFRGAIDNDMYVR